jgi:hypothetical protein
VGEDGTAGVSGQWYGGNGTQDHGSKQPLGQVGAVGR